MAGVDKEKEWDEKTLSNLRKIKELIDETRQFCPVRVLNWLIYPVGGMSVDRVINELINDFETFKPI